MSDDEDDPVLNHRGHRGHREEEEEEEEEEVQDEVGTPRRADIDHSSLCPLCPLWFI
jgi:hypothetical protein